MKLLTNGFRDGGEVTSREAKTNKAGGSAVTQQQDLAIIAGRYRQKLIQKGVDQVGKFSWRLAAQRVLETYDLAATGVVRATSPAERRAVSP